MRADFLKIAGVKSEAEFYKKFPSEEAFMKKHGKAVKKLMAKKAQVGTMIPNIETPKQNLTPISFDNDYMNDSVAKLTGGKTSQELRDEAMYQAKMADFNKPEKPGFMEQITNVAQGAFSGMNNSAKNGGKFEPHMMYNPKTKKGKKAKTYKEHLALKKKGWGHTAPKAQKGAPITPGWGGRFMMFDKANDIKKAYKEYTNQYRANNPGWNVNENGEFEKVDLSKMEPILDERTETVKSFRENFPKAQVGINQIGSGIDYVNQTPNIFESGNFQQPNIGQAYSSPMAQSFNIQSGQSFGQNAQNVINSDGFKTGLSIVNDGFNIKDQIKAQIDNLAQARQNTKVAEVALQASQTMPEKIERQYARPEDYVTSGSHYAKGGGTYKAKDGDSVEEMTPQMREYLSALESMKTKRDAIGRNDKEQLASFAGRNKPFTPYGNNELARDFSELQKLRQSAGLGMMEEASILLPHVGQQIRGGFNSMLGTNFKNGGAYKAQDGGMFNGEYMPLTNPNQTKQFAGGGFVYGGGPAGQAGTQFAGMLGVNDDAGSNIGGKVGSTAGMAIGGPLGAFIGGAFGSGIGDLLDRNDRRVGIEQDKLSRIVKEMAAGSVAPSIQAGYASHRKNGGKIESMRSGGHMRGNYIPPNPSALDTMAMGGELKTLWGGKAETVSYNPYAGGESIQFKGNSHSKRDPKTGETGIGVAYGENAVNSNKPSVEVENEPAQKLRDGGGDENLVVFGDMYTTKELVSLIGDDRAKNKKIKNYVSDVLNKDEAKINKKQAKASELGLESDNTVVGQIERGTADVNLKAAETELKAIGNIKHIINDYQQAMNETFNQYSIDANKFLKNGKMVKDPMRIENSQVSKYGNNVPKAEDGDDVPSDKLKTNELPDEPKVFDSVEEAEKAGFSYNQEKDRWEKETSKGTESAELSIEALEEVRKGQGENKETGLFGNVTIEQFEESKKANPWFDWEKFDPNNEADVTRYQEEFNRRAKESGDPTRLQIDGRFGEQTASARFSQAQEATGPEYEFANVTQPEENVQEELENKKEFPMLNFQRPIDDESLDANQLLGEYYAMATNQVQPVQAQGFQPRLRDIYDISLQAQKNQVISQQRALMRNPILQNNPAAAAMVSAQASDQLQQINEKEFIANQQMRDTVSSQNLNTLNQAKLTNLGIFDKQADRQAQAAANTRTQGIDILSSISNKYAQNKRDNAMRKVYANMYPTFRFNDDYQTEVVQPTQFNTGQGSTGVPSLATPGIVSPNTRQVGNVLNQLFGAINQDDNTSNAAKYGKKVTKNNKNSNILKAIKNL